MTTASILSDAQLEADLTRLARCEREATVALLVLLGEFDARRLYAAAGFPSMFRYCLEVLRLAEDATYNRIQSARAARRFPLLLERLASGDLTLTTARQLGPRLTEQNQAELFAAAARRTKEQVEAMLAARFPAPDVAPRVRKLAEPRSAGSAGNDGSAGVTVPTTVNAPPRPESNANPSGVVCADAAQAPPANRAVVRHLAPERYEIRFTARAETRELLRLSQDLLGDGVSSSDLDEVFRRSLKLLVKELARRRFAATEAPRGSRGQADGSRHIPAAVKRIVWVRDRGQCAFVATSGRPCESRRNLEFHHVDPYAVGGKATSENVQLRCPAHNRPEAQLFYGPMREYAAGGPAGTRSGTSSGVGGGAAMSGPGG
jgi:hypothetical protein